jgi:hypothetical protein
MTMRRGLSIAVLAATAGLALPAAASAQCSLPKSIYTANAQYQYAVDLFGGQLQTSLAQLLAAARNPGDQAALNAALANVASGNASRGADFATASQQYLTSLTRALAEDSPQCATPPTTRARYRHRR